MKIMKNLKFDVLSQNIIKLRYLRIERFCMNFLIFFYKKKEKKRKIYFYLHIIPIYLIYNICNKIR